MKILFAILLFVPFLSQAVEVKITHPRIEQKPMKVFAFTCKKCDEVIAKDLAELEKLSLKVETKKVPSPPERGSRIVMIRNENSSREFYLPPATRWTKEEREVNVKISEILTKLEFQVEKARARK